MRRVLLVDNGSLEAASTRQLRCIAAGVEARLGVKVDAVSLAHSNKVPAEALGGQPAELLADALERVVREGVRELIVAPQFIGPSYAIVRHVPALVAEKTAGVAGLRVAIAAPLWIEGERRLAEILVDGVRGVIRGDETGVGKVRVAVVDHGSPSRAVTVVRDAVAAQVREMLGDEVSEVAACSMERREGAEFDFNEPTLARLLERDGWRDGELVVALLFLAPGKHAGPDGDVARIVRTARGGEAKAAGERRGSATPPYNGGEGGGGVSFTPLMGEHPRLVEILVERVRAAEQTLADGTGK